MDVPQIRAWKDDEDPTYIVQVGEEMYEMSADADSPGGVCSYVGTAGDLAWTVRAKPVQTLPLGIVRKVAAITATQEVAG